ncbi:MAG TPA: hypothetical protein VI603_09260, partial [Saprospiraceae bacterium]|nr:hypothetical protein [Saprospiraceae bacterium]
YHQHLHCTATASDVHLHADVYNCNLCDYLTTVTFFFDFNTRQVSTVDCNTPELVTLHHPFLQTQPGSEYLRGPPAGLI